MNNYRLVTTILIIAGGRDFAPKPIHYGWLAELHATLLSRVSQAELLPWHSFGPIEEVVCGMAPGADLFGKAWAESMGIPVLEFPANWRKYGRSAGPIRNREMALQANSCVLFPGGKGTQNMFETATEFGLKIYDWRERKEGDLLT